MSVNIKSNEQRLEILEELVTVHAAMITELRGMMSKSGVVTPSKLQCDFDMLMEKVTLMQRKVKHLEESKQDRIKKFGERLRGR